MVPANLALLTFMPAAFFPSPPSFEVPDGLQQQRIDGHKSWQVGATSSCRIMQIETSIRQEKPRCLCLGREEDKKKANLRRTEP